MHEAPAVDYPVGGSRFYRRALLVAATAAVGVELLWFAQAHLVAWHWWLGIASTVIFCALALRAARDSPDGVLRWVGRSWWREGNGVRCSGTLEVCLDLQNLILLRFRDESGARHWLWLEQTAATDRWSALRRAVHVPAVAEEDRDRPASPTNLPQSGDVAPL